MKLLLAIIVLILIAGSIYADYRWKKWIAARKQEHDR